MKPWRRTLLMFTLMAINIIAWHSGQLWFAGFFGGCALTLAMTEAT